jgi:hypothetical protein
MTASEDYDPLMGAGYFDVWLEGASFATPVSGTCIATLFRALYDGAAGTFAIEQGGGPLVPGAPNGLRWSQTVAGSGSTYRMIEARIEDATLFSQDDRNRRLALSRCHRASGLGRGRPSSETTHVQFRYAIDTDKAVRLRL